MKNIILIFFLGIVIARPSSACSWYDIDGDYYNLFIQEMINDPRYYPFLLSLEWTYYQSEYPKATNENIEEWQLYLWLIYDNTYYLVFTATRNHISAAIAGKPVADKKLGFLTPEFVKQHKQALLYLAYAKYLEPYMRITHSSDNEWDYFPEDTKTADQLNYDQVMNVLQKSWNAETDKELKLRYGYQMVRFAHYNRHYDTAIRMFDEYVEPLAYRPVMYYYALAQKAGAMRGNDDVMEANAVFFHVFAHSSDLKEMALNSIRLNGVDIDDFMNFIKSAKTETEKNDAYLLLGYQDFNNPLNEIGKITAATPDAIQAKVLMARAVNQIERDAMQVYKSRSADNVQKLKDKRYPVTEESSFIGQALTIAKEMSTSAKVKDPVFWNITAAYLSFLNKDFAAAKTMLEKVNTTDEKYTMFKKSLAMYIDISEQPVITPALEAGWYAKYADVLQAAKRDEYSNTPQNFVIDVLANRYFLQKDDAKSFLLNNDVTALERNPQMELIDAVEKFYRKGNMNAMEKFIASRGGNTQHVPDYLNYVRGVVYLTKGDMKKADEAFRQASNEVSSTNIHDKIFGYNRIECFECDEEEVMTADYLNDFSAIAPDMDYASLTKALLELQKEGSGTGLRAAKANYLLGNFFYNVTPTGYFRNVLRYSNSNGNGYYSDIYDWFTSKPDIYKNIYFKFYPYYYDDDPITISQQYLEKAYKQANNDELKARIVFALSKCEQELYYKNNNMTGGWSNNDHTMLIKDRKYFAELMKYRQTQVYSEIESLCLYFSYYVNHYSHP